MRIALVLVACLAITGCGAAKKPSAYAQANLALLEGLPVYPGAARPKTTTSGTSTSQFAARDWTLPAGATADTVVTWYQQRLPADGWKIVGKSFETLRGTRGGASLAVGVRRHTLEAVANSRGA